MKKQNSFFWIALIMILMAALMRLWIYPANFSPVIAMALFGGAVFKDKKMAFLLPLLAMFISDAAMEYSGIATGFWGWGQVAGYCILGLITILAFSMKKINVKNVLLYAIGASLFFYTLSNATVWIFDSHQMYARNWQGFVNCMVAGIPFIKNTLLATLVFSGVLFGGYVLFTSKSTAVQPV